MSASKNGRHVGDPQRAPRAPSGMRLTWSPEAIGDLLSLRGHIAVDDPAAAKRVALHIIRSVEELLSQNSQLGHPARLEGFGEPGAAAAATTPLLVYDPASR
jgi:plasmid stabilization system protein ParE